MARKLTIALIALLEALSNTGCIGPSGSRSPSCNFCYSNDVPISDWRVFSSDVRSMTGQKVSLIGIADIGTGREMALIDRNKDGSSGMLMYIKPGAFDRFGTKVTHILSQCHSKEVVVSGTYLGNSNVLINRDGSRMVMDSGHINDITCIEEVR